MDAKSFVLGALAGVAGFAIVDRLIHPAPERQGVVATPANSADDPPIRAEPNTGTEVGTIPVTEKDVPAGPTPQGEAMNVVGAPEIRRAGRADAGERGEAVADTSEQEKDWPRGFVGSDAQTAAARAAEAKDVAWSYQMEQLLTQYLATHPPAAHFEIRSIDCRTTFCMMRATSSHEDANPMWIQISHDISKQPWSEFGPSGTSMGRTASGGAALIMFLERNGRSR